MKLMALFALLLVFVGACAMLNAQCEQRVGSGTLVKEVETGVAGCVTLVLVWQEQESLLLDAGSVHPHPPLIPGRFYEVWQAPDGTVSIR